MSDVFISYASADRLRAKEIAARFAQEGWSVFWDRTIPVGRSWIEIIEKEISSAKVIVVLWSKNSIKSNWVFTEAEEGLKRRILAPAILERVNIPLLFRRIQTADLSKLETGGDDTEGILMLIQAISNIGNLPMENSHKPINISFENSNWKFRLLVTIGALLLIVVFFLIFHSVKNNGIVTDLMNGQQNNQASNILESAEDMMQDIEGNTYGVVKIGGQLWMSENLRTTKLRDSSTIQLVPGAIKWGMLNSPGFCWPDNEAKNKDVYGALYNWHTVNTGKLCPKGWHIPNDEEWTVLSDYLIDNGYGHEGNLEDIAKSLASKENWDFHPIAGTPGNDTAFNNSSGFSGLPGGSRSPSGIFLKAGYYGGWWSSTESSIKYAWHRSLFNDYPLFNRSKAIKVSGLSVRCIQD